MAKFIVSAYATCFAYRTIEVDCATAQEALVEAAARVQGDRVADATWSVMPELALSDPADFDVEGPFDD